MSSAVGAAPDPGSIVPEVGDWLDHHSGGATLLGICATAGGRLLASVLHRTDLGRIQGSLVEADAEHAATVSLTLRQAGLSTVSVVHGDPGSALTYAGRVPADLVILGPDVVDGPAARRRGYAEALPELLTARGHVCWWSARAGDLTPWLRMLEAAGVHELASGYDGTSGLARLVDRPRSLRGGGSFFPADPGHSAAAVT